MGPWEVSCSETSLLDLVGAVLSSEFPLFLVKIFATAPPVS